MTGALGHARLLCSRLRNIKSLICNIIDCPVVVLCYHRVTSRLSDMNSVVVSPDNFRAQMDYVKRNFRIVRFEENWEQLDTPAVVVTFDDGYADNLTEALPILKEMGVPATFFITAGNIDARNEFWWDALERMLSGLGGYPARFSLQDSRHGREWPTLTAEDRVAMFRDMHSLFMSGTKEQRVEWLRQVVGWAGGNCPEAHINRLLTGDELRTLADNAEVTIGAHSVTHPRLSTLPEEEQRQEIVGSKTELEKLLGREITLFAYPFGKRADFDTTSARICNEAGYLKAAAAFQGEAHRWTDPYQIPRHFVYNWDLDRFIFKLKRLWV
ncbi:MAG: polysaccharide deacetylase family protein [Desulfuromonadaceae bacterium]|nr:polysaccharide deacetylase family protein [Desulfuromonadaceae bacterium]